MIGHQGHKPLQIQVHHRLERRATSMTTLLEKALAEVAKLTPEAQDAIAALILEELEDEQRWEATFAATQPQLAKLAEKVRGDIRAGRVRKMGFDAR
jgi:DNA-binding MarR family transcriptional regulator